MKCVITGGHGFGKTTLINELKKSGYWGGREVFDEIILRELESGGDALPWKDRRKFEDIALPIKIQEYINAPNEDI